MSDAKDVTFSLKVMINKERTKVLFAVADGDFVDVLLSFLTLPLGRTVKALEKQYGDKAPVIGSLTTLYKGLADLDSDHFWTEGANLLLLDPESSFESDCKRLKLDITDPRPSKYFVCSCGCGHRILSVSMYYDQIEGCIPCFKNIMTKETAKKESEATVCGGGVFTMNTMNFVISDDLQILPTAAGLLQTIAILGITDTYEAELINVTTGLSDIMDLLKASFISQTPLSDLILKKTTLLNSTVVKSEQRTPSNQADEVTTSNPKNMILKVIFQKSTGNLLFAQADKDFVEFLFSFLTIPVGGVECLLENKGSIKSIDNLYRSVADLIDNKFFMTSDAKNRLIKPNLPHGYISQDHIFPLTEETFSISYTKTFWLSSYKFPRGQGNYLKGLRTYKVADDLTVTPFCVASTLSSLNRLKIPISDVEELELCIGLEEGLSILKASLTSTSALSNGLMNQILKKKPKQEH